MYDLAIIGGGIVGAATWYEIQRRYPNKTIVLLEKEDRLAAHQSGNNSGVIHSGLYYTPGSLKAKNCVRGRQALVAFAREHKIPHDVCGKVIVATEERELLHMDRIYRNGIANGIEGLEVISGDQIRDHEPFVEGIKGLYVPVTGIIDYAAATARMAEIANALNPDSEMKPGNEVRDIQHSEGYSAIVTNKGTYDAKNLVFCAGLQADRLARRDGVDLPERVVGFRGDYYELTESGRHKVRHLIYPVPDPRFPFLGAHFTRMINGEIECGPNAVLTFSREGYGKTDFNLHDTWEALTYSGTWKLFTRSIAYGIGEYRRTFSKKFFLKTLQRMIPGLTMEDIRPGRAGVRALLLEADGKIWDDFRIERRGNSIHVLNAPSPAATASLAIAENIADMSRDYFGWA